MGQSASTASLPCADPRVPYFAVTFQSPDKLTLALTDENMIDITRKAILESASDDECQNDTFLHCERVTDTNIYEFKFRGYPFMRGCSDSANLRSKRMCCFMFQMYEEHGWTLCLASDLSRGKEMTTWFFQRKPTMKRVEDTKERENVKNGWEDKNILCIGISAGCKIQLVNGSEKSHRLLAAAVKSIFPSDCIKNESVTDDGDYEIELADQPWLSSDRRICIQIRKLLLQIIRVFENLARYKFYGTVNLKGSTDSLFFVKPDDEEEDDEERCYFAISLNCGRCITIIEPPSTTVVQAVLRAIVLFWPEKLHSKLVVEDLDVHEFRLKGNPWHASGGQEAISARSFICGLLGTLQSDGYEPVVALDVSRGHPDKATFIFRSKHSSAGSLPHNPLDKARLLSKGYFQHYWCIGLQDQSKLRLIGEAPSKSRSAVYRAIQQIWPWGIQQGRNEDSESECVFKLKTGPWGAEQHENVVALMCYILKNIHEEGYRVVLSADVTGRYISNNHGGSHSLDLHSWFVTNQGQISKAETSAERNLSESEDVDDDDVMSPLRDVITISEHTDSKKKQQGTRRKISTIECSTFVATEQTMETAVGKARNSIDAVLTNAGQKKEMHKSYSMNTED